MSLLRQIQDSAASSDTSVATLLRKCKILAARLGSDEVGQWVDNELNGYESDKDLPDYRNPAMVESCGNFSGPLGSGINHAPIPSITIPEDLRNLVEEMPLGHGISVYEDLLSDKQQGTFQMPWPSNLVAFVGQRIYRGYNCMQAWKVLPRSTLVSLTEAVRNRILNFALEIEKENPEAGEAPLGTNPIPPHIVHQVFHNTFFGNVANVAAGSSDFKQSTVKPE